MSADLDTTEGQVSYVDSRSDAWHQLGQQLDGAFDAKTAMEQGHLGGWDVRKEPMVAMLDGDAVLVTDRRAVVRTNPISGKPDYLGIVSPTYHIIQNEDHVALLDALVDESGAHFETAGAINGGRRVFVSMKLPGHMLVGGVDRVDLYIVAVNSHDGTLPFTIMTAPVRPVCKNTLNLAFGAATNLFRVRHTSGAGSIIQSEARAALDLTFAYADALQEEAERLIQTTMTQSQFEAIIEAEFGPQDDDSKAAATRAQKKVDALCELFADAPTQENIRGTAWAGLNALTEWADHMAPVRGDQDVSRAQRAVFDPSFKNRALALMTR